jgi:hypothetical protein
MRPALEVSESWRKYVGIYGGMASDYDIISFRSEVEGIDIKRRFVSCFHPELFGTTTPSSGVIDAHVIAMLGLLRCRSQLPLVKLMR